jgi:outer membrane protein assembly factor BamB
MTAMDDWRKTRRRYLRATAGLGVGSVVGSRVIADGVAAETSGGDEIWRFETGGPVYTSSPTVVEGTVFVGSTDTNLYAVDAGDGTEQWRFETGGPVYSSSPAVVEGTVFVGSADNNLSAVDAARGEEQWTFETGDNLLSSPTVVDGTVFVGSKDINLYAVDAGDGTEQWRFKTSGNVYSSPTVVDGTVYVGCEDTNLYAVDASTGTEQWRCKTGGMVSSSPTVVDGTVYVGSDDENLYLVDASDGTEQWLFETGGQVLSSPTVVDGTIFIGTSDDNLYAVDASTGNEQWRYEIGRAVDSSPTVVDGTVFVGSWDDLYAVDASTGTEKWRYETGGTVRSSPTVVDGTLYVGSADNHLYAVEADVSGSSEGSRVMLGTLGHHGESQPGDPVLKDPPTDTPTETPSSAAVRGDDESLPWLKIGLGIAAGATGVAAGLLRSRGKRDDSDTGPDEPLTPSAPEPIDRRNVDRVGSDESSTPSAEPTATTDSAAADAPATGNTSDESPPPAPTADTLRDELGTLENRLSDVEEQIDTGHLDAAENELETIEAELSAVRSRAEAENFDAVLSDCSPLVAACDDRRDEIETAREQRRNDDPADTGDDTTVQKERVVTRIDEVRRILRDRVERAARQIPDDPTEAHEQFQAVQEDLTALRNDAVSHDLEYVQTQVQQLDGVVAVLATAADHLQTARQARDAANYETAIDAFETALEQAETAQDRATETDRSVSKAVDDVVAAIKNERNNCRHQWYETATERAETARKRARELTSDTRTDEGAPDVAIDAYKDAARPTKRLSNLLMTRSEMRTRSRTNEMQSWAPWSANAPESQSTKISTRSRQTWTVSKQHSPMAILGRV